MRPFFFTTSLAAALLAAPALQAQTPPAEPQTEMNSPGMLIAGSITAGLGAAAFTTGLLVPLAYDDEQDGMTGGWLFIGGMALGGTLTLVGVPLIIAGVWQVPVAEGADIAIGPGGATLRGSF